MKINQFVIVAGEASGDMYGAEVARALRKRFEGVHVCGVGGERMREAGVDLVGDSSATAVVGPFEAIGYFGKLYGLFRRTLQIVESPATRAVILVDFPEFNLRLASRAKAAGVPVVYYVSPQVWAWREGRIRQIGRVVDKMLVILPFEEAIYRKIGLDVEFVGHPLVDIVRTRMSKPEFLTKYGLDRAKPIVAILPGSREKEIQFILPTLCRAVDLMLKHKPGIQFVMPVAPGLELDFVRRFIGSRPVCLVSGDNYDAVRHSCAAVVASGTATLETALLGTPQVIVYRIGKATWLLGKILLKVRMFGLVNIILGKEIIPELYQDRMTPENVASIILKMMDDVWMQSEIRGSYEELRRELGTGGVADRVATAVGAVAKTAAL